ncbi:MAG TPA: hypothetical protein VMN60_06020 [Longimicrobiales bacterium]|nr:hypothetical protein [Longimicrobiales bacterium]
MSVLALVLGAGIYLYAHKDEGRLSESKARGGEIVAVLERYRAAAGDYPETLEGLVPEYLAVIEPPTWGLRRWKYERLPVAGDGIGAGDGSRGGRPEQVYFTLSVAANETGYPVLYYDVTARRWVLNN